MRRAPTGSLRAGFYFSESAEEDIFQLNVCLEIRLWREPTSVKAHCDPTKGGNKVDPHESKQKEGGETEDNRTQPDVKKSHVSGEKRERQQEKEDKNKETMYRGRGGK